MLYSTVLAVALPFFTVAQAATLLTEYSGSTFFDAWTFLDAADTTTAGQVQYVDQATANSDGLAYVNSGGSVVIAVDDTTTLAAGALRNSVRITSNQAYSIGSIFIGDFSHVPYGCSVWGAFWLLGPNWPTTGEIDIIEGVNSQASNQMTLHTDAGCTHDNSAAETGTVLLTDCNSGAGTTNDGCGVEDENAASAAGGLAAAGGAVFATSWTTDGISIWRWSPGSVPADVTSGAPDYTSWGTPTATWAADDCDPTAHFSELQIVFDITLCGDWAGQATVWADSSCSASYSTCSAAVSDPANFDNAYFEVNSVKVYTV